MESGSGTDGAPRWRSALRWFAGASVIGIVLYALLAAYADLRAVAHEVRQFRLWTLFAALGLVFMSYGIRIIRWQLLLKRLGRPVPWIVGGSAFLAGFSLSVTPAKLGEIVKAYYLRAHVPYRDSIAAIVAERFLDGSTIVVLFALGAVLATGTNPWLGLALLVLLFAGLVFLRHATWVPRLLGVVGRGRWGRRAIPHLRDHHARVRALLGGPTFALVGLLGLVAWSLEPVALYLLAYGFHVELSLAECYFLFGAATLAGVLTMLPGGLGATEGTMVALLAVRGIGLGVATPLVLAFRLSTLWFGVALGIGAMLALGGLRATRPQRDPRHGRPAESVLPEET